MSKRATESLRERFAVVQQTPVLVALLVTTIWATGAYTVYSYLAPYLTGVAGIEDSQIGLDACSSGAARRSPACSPAARSATGSARAQSCPGLALLALAFASLSFVPSVAAGKILLGCVAVAIVLWGIAGWGFFPAQQARLIGIAGVKVAPIALSLNASFMYLGFCSAPRSDPSR